MDRKHLAMALSRIPDPPDPETKREQVRTPGDLAADFLRLARDHDSLEGKRVVDLGAGTGVLAIGALLLGAERAVAVEVEPRLLEIAQAAAENVGVGESFIGLEADVSRLEPAVVNEHMDGPVDLVIMNPPFGADRRSRHAGGDRVFLSLALRLAPVVYSLHLAETKAFLSAYAQDAGFRFEVLKEMDFPLPARFAHHRSNLQSKRVVVARYTRDRK